MYQIDSPRSSNGPALTAANARSGGFSGIGVPAPTAPYSTAIRPNDHDRKMTTAATELLEAMAAARGLPPVEWAIADEPVDYPEAVAAMEERVAAIRAGRAPELVWLVEHPPIYTAGTSARDGDLLSPGRFPVHRTGRGGQFTYHGPGQRVAYTLLDLNRRRPDLRLFVAALEDWIVRTLAAFNVGGERRDGRVGIWVPRPDKGAEREDKIAAIGIRVRHWVTFHGVALNVDPNLDHYAGIVPCGVRGQGVTSLADLGIPVSMPEVDAALRREFEALFGETTATRSAAP
jgi:lipoyl(octanoyl) transferase